MSGIGHNPGMAHLSDEQLVALLDGEAGRGDAAQSRAHLETCWQCRARMHDVETSVRNFVEAREMLRPAADQLPPAPVEQFRQRLLHHAAQNTGPISISEAAARMARQVRVFVFAHKRAAVAALAAAAIFIVTFTDVLSTTASAETILLRAQSFETKRQPSREQVEVESVRVQAVNRRTHAVKPLGELAWVEDGVSHLAEVKATTGGASRQEQLVRNDSEAGAFVARWMRDAGAMNGPLGAYLQAQQWRADVSVPAFRKLIEGRGSSTSSVEKRDGLYTLHFSFAPNHVSGISEALLAVRSSDFEPMSVAIVTNDSEAPTEYRFDRVAFGLAARTPEFAKLFDVPPVTPAAASIGLPRPTPVSYLATPPSSLEVAAIVALHKQDACLGEEINVFPMSDGSVMVQGLVDRTDRRDALRRALSTLPGSLTAHIFTPGEVRSASDLYTPPDQIVTQSGSSRPGTPMTLADLSNEQMPLYAQLMIHFSAGGRPREEAQAKLAAFSNELVSSARQTLMHAWALKRLEHEFPAERQAALSAGDKAALEQIRADHRRWISILSKRQHEMLAQIGAEGTSGRPLPADASSDLILQTAETENSLIRSLFTVSTEGENPSASLNQLMTLLTQLGG